MACIRSQVRLKMGLIGKVLPIAEINQQKGTSLESLEEFRKLNFLINVREMLWKSRAFPDLKQDVM